MYKQKFPQLFILVVLLAFVSAACTTEALGPEEDTENLAFSSNGPAIPDVTVGGDKTFYKFELNNGKPNWSNNGTYWLGIVADEKVRQVYIYAEGKNTSWRHINSSSADKDPDRLLRNRPCGVFNSEKTGMHAFDIGPLVYVTYGNKYATLRVDAGEVFRKSGLCGSFPSGISCVDMLPFPNTHDFKGGPVFIGVTKKGFVAGSSSIDGPYLVPSGKSPSDVNSVNSKGTAGNVACLNVISNKAVDFTLKNGSVVRGSAQRGVNEFIKVD